MSLNVPSGYFDSYRRCEQCGKCWHPAEKDCDCVVCIVCGEWKPPHEIAEAELCFDCFDKENMPDA